MSEAATTEQAENDQKTSLDLMIEKVRRDTVLDLGTLVAVSVVVAIVTVSTINDWPTATDSVRLFVAACCLAMLGLWIYLAGSFLNNLLKHRELLTEKLLRSSNPR